MPIRINRTKPANTTFYIILFIQNNIPISMYLFNTEKPQDQIKELRSWIFQSSLFSPTPNPNECWIKFQPNVEPNVLFFSQPGYYFIYLFPRQDLAPTVRYQDSIRCVELLAHYWLYVVYVKCRHAWPLHSFLGHWRHYHVFSKTRFLYVPFRSRDHHALLICSFGTNHSILIFIVRPCLYRWLVARV